MHGNPPGQGRLYSEEERQASLETMLAGVSAEDALWVFAYGSLMWRPCFAPAEEQVAQVYGWHRALDVHAIADRGSLDVPGLWFGLAPGGSVCGLALRVPRDGRTQMLARLWRREMPDDAYVPRWLVCHLPHGRVVRALAFVSNRSSMLYAGKLERMEIARRVAQASGALGSACCYVMRTQAALRAYGLKDHKLDAVAGWLQARHGACRERGGAAH